jgi:hypothetical protein
MAFTNYVGQSEMYVSVIENGQNYHAAIISLVRLIRCALTCTKKRVFIQDKNLIISKRLRVCMCAGVYKCFGETLVPYT